MNKSQKYLELVEDLKKLANEPVVLIDEAAVDGEVVQMMRELRQFIERFRRLIEPDDVHHPLAFDDIQKLGRDELSYIVRKFWMCCTEDGDCPRELCNDYFCCYCQHHKEECDDYLANGDLSAEDYNQEAENGFFDGDCNLTQDGCWVDYYLWCYRNGYNPDTGKKKERKDA